MNKEFIVGRTYRMWDYPDCVAEYMGEGRGKGVSICGENTDNVGMLTPESWEVVLETDSTTNHTFEEAFDLNNGDAARVFESGASRNSDEGKLDFEGFLSPTVLKAYAEYMNENTYLENGTRRDSDNWQKGIPIDAYMKSMFRHFFDTWSTHRGIETPETQKQNLCGLLFNVMGMLHETLKLEGNV